MGESNEYLTTLAVYPTLKIFLTWLFEKIYEKIHKFICMMEEKMQYMLCSVTAWFSAGLVLESRSCCRATSASNVILWPFLPLQLRIPCAAHWQVGRMQKVGSLSRRGSTQLYGKLRRCQMIRCVINTACVLKELEYEYSNHVFRHWSVLTFQYLDGLSEYI